MGTRVLSLRVPQPAPNVNYSPPSSAEVKNEWIYTSTPPYKVMAWTWTNELFKSLITFTKYVVTSHDCLCLEILYKNMWCIKLTAMHFLLQIRQCVFRITEWKSFLKKDKRRAKVCMQSAEVRGLGTRIWSEVWRSETVCLGIWSFYTPDGITRGGVQLLVENHHLIITNIIQFCFFVLYLTTLLIAKFR
jgi:hypothetical protein